MGGKGAQQTGGVTVAAGEREEGVGAMMKMPLTEFLIEMMKADRTKLDKADPQKLAAKYGIDADTATAYLRLWRG